MCAAHGNLYYAVTGMNDALYTRTFTESGGWGAVKKWDGYRSFRAPNLAVDGTDNNRVFMTHTAGDGSIYHQSNSGTGFGSAVGDNMNWRTDSPVTMASTPTRLWRVVRGTDNKIYTSGHAGSYRFGGEEIKNWPTPHGRPSPITPIGCGCSCAGRTAS